MEMNGPMADPQRIMGLWAAMGEARSDWPALHTLISTLGEFRDLEEELSDPINQERRHPGGCMESQKSRLQSKGPRSLEARGAVSGKGGRAAPGRAWAQHRPLPGRSGEGNRF